MYHTRICFKATCIVARHGPVSPLPRPRPTPLPVKMELTQTRTPPQRTAFELLPVPSRPFHFDSLAARSLFIALTGIPYFLFAGEGRSRGTGQRPDSARLCSQGWERRSCRDGGDGRCDVRGWRGAHRCGAAAGSFNRSRNRGRTGPVGTRTGVAG